jgi:site-specific DNA-methyltransferase (adenine-specific)
VSVGLHHGDCLDVLATLHGLDACVTDPPYGLAFMGRQWDRDIAFQPATWRLVFAALKPGAHLAAFGGTRTSHRMVCAIEDAGFEIRDTVLWLYGSGFPKTKNALKPACEPIVLARKPLVGTVAANVLAHGVGGINVDACRIEGVKPVMERTATIVAATSMSGTSTGARSTGEMTTEGRWPANVVHDGSDEVLEAFAAFGERKSCNAPSSARPEGAILGGRRSQGAIYPGDTGTAARFYYCAKASAADRCGSKHPTIKPVSLIRWLVRLITPPGGTVLDPFAGSGTTGEAAQLEGMNAVLIEREAEYAADIRRRVSRWTGQDTTLFTAVAD